MRNRRWGTYQIQRETREGWTKAWGYSDRTYPAADSDEEAIAVFRRETSKVKSVPHRLMRMEPSPIKELARVGKGELLARDESMMIGTVVAEGKAPAKKKHKGI